MKTNRKRNIMYISCFIWIFLLGILNVSSQITKGLETISPALNPMPEREPNLPNYISDQSCKANGFNHIVLCKDMNNLLLSFQAEETTDISLNIYDLTGRLILSDKIREHEKTIQKKYNVQPPAGIYILQLSNRNGSLTGKFYLS